jgi:uncharacterized membrane protein YagU involved in acid resistance
MIRDALRGAIAGAVATWCMDRITTAMYEVQAPEVTDRETAAQPNDKSSVANLVDRIEAQTGFVIPADTRPIVEQAIHYGLGIGPGAVYGVVRRYVPFARLGRGLAYGFVLFVVNDEYLNTKLGLAGPPEAYPPESHVRGLVGHAVLGVSTETGIQLLGG